MHQEQVLEIDPGQGDDHEVLLRGGSGILPRPRELRRPVAHDKEGAKVRTKQMRSLVEVILPRATTGGMMDLQGPLLRHLAQMDTTLLNFFTNFDHLGGEETLNFTLSILTKLAFLQK